MKPDIQSVAPQKQSVPFGIARYTVHRRRILCSTTPEYSTNSKTH